MFPSDKDEREADPLKSQVRPALLRWYDDNRRDLPWRRTCDPYRIWVSEIMLQQTTVRTVLRYYERFLGRFPSVEELSKAELSEVLKFWEGLGYYQRAKNLHRAARIVASVSPKTFPGTIEEWQALPGIGRSTAGAIHSLSRNLWAPILDANVRRVTLRFFGFSLEEPALERLLWAASDSWGLHNPRPADTNQALMELGAVCCLPMAPACDQCPVAAFCEIRHSFSSPDCLKDKTNRPGRKNLSPLRTRVALIPSSGSLLFEPREEGRLLEGLLEVSGFVSTGLKPGEVIPKGAFAGWTVQEEIGCVRQVYSHFREEIRVFRIRSPMLPDGREPEKVREGGVWATVDGAKNLALTGVARKILSILQTQESENGSSSEKSSQWGKRTDKTKKWGKREPFLKGPDPSFF